MLKPPARAWAEIDLDRLAHNGKELVKAVANGTSLMGVVKADAYGHGSVQVARVLRKLGIRALAVASVDEAIRLRRSGIRGEILILGYTPEHRFADLVRCRLSQTIVGADYAEKLQAYGKRIRVHVKIDTGMGRLGERYDRIKRLLSIYRHSRLRVEGTFSHLATADSADEDGVWFAEAQHIRFRRAIERIKEAGIDPGRLHLHGSGGLLRFGTEGMDLARPGIALFGYPPDYRVKVEVATPVQLLPVLSLKALVSHVKEMEADESVGYDRAYLLARKSVIATLSIGYADGVARELSERRGYVLIRGQRAPMVGKICMDQLMVDVTGIEGVSQGDVATLIGQDGDEIITAEHIAQRLGTLPNEVLVSIGARVERRYSKKS
ncbi:serine racemase VanT catalytic subunit [Paenibacillus sp. NPDC058071]|uniref:serine racemase VanT catalytic subunit n=1 Tax=Paenibacillus sp. NPDC058071 TaxID=3346326 RepID=UPI0036D9D2F0